MLMTDLNLSNNNMNIHTILSRGGPTSLAFSNYVGKHGELTLDPITGHLTVHNGIKAGGFPVNIDCVAVTGSVILSARLTILTGGTGTYNVTLPIASYVGETYEVYEALTGASGCNVLTNGQLLYYNSSNIIDDQDDLTTGVRAMYTWSGSFWIVSRQIVGSPD